MHKLAVQDAVQDAEGWLQGLRDLDNLINAKIEERDQVMTMATKITPNTDGMPHGSGISDKVGNAAVKLADMADEINSLVDDLIDYKCKVNTALGKLSASDQLLLHRHYIQGMSWTDIADMMDLSGVHVWRLKVKALENLQHVMPCSG